MNIKVVIQLVVFTLLGFLAKAEEPRWDKQPMACDHPCCSPASRAQATIGYQEDHVGFATQPPRHKQLKCRTRFRAAASFAASSTPFTDGSRSYDHSSMAEPLPGSNTQCILPFYYIFLFRFTPF